MLRVQLIISTASPLHTKLTCVISPEFKEIRKEWKARKKEEENQRKADDERQRAAAQADGQSADPAQAPPQNYPPGVRPQLPPIGYAPAGAQVPGQYPGGVEQMYQQGNGQVYPGYPHSPYGQGQQMYQQRHTPFQSEEEPDADLPDVDPDPPNNYTS